MDLDTLPKVERGECKCPAGRCAAPLDYWMVEYEPDPKNCLISRPTRLTRAICRLEQAAARGWTA